MNVSIYIKTNFRGNPRGAGAAAAIVEYTDKAGNSHLRKQRAEVEKDTKNALCLKTCNAAMRLLLKPCKITIFIDCDYMGNACRLGWLNKWQQDGWLKANKKPPENVEEWKQFFMLTQIHTVDFKPYTEKYETELESIIGGTHEIHGIESKDHKIHSADHSTKD